MAFASFSSVVDAPLELLWEVLLEKVEHPERHTGNVEGVDVLERSGATLVRRLRTAAGEVTERVTVDPDALRIDSEFLDHPQYTGTMVKKIVPPEAAGDPQGRPALTYTLDWEPRTAALQGQDLTPLVMAGVKHTAKVAEARARQERA